jgi:hypothetical protein
VLKATSIAGVPIVGPVPALNHHAIDGSEGKELVLDPAMTLLLVVNIIGPYMQFGCYIGTADASGGRG